MIIANGKIYDSGLQDKILSCLEQNINKTLRKKPIDTKKVISAIDRLGKDIGAGKYDSEINALPVDEPQRYKALAAAMLSRENLELKLKTELGITPKEMGQQFGTGQVNTKIMPLGVLLHIAAGNMDGLPAFSLAEGLLTGNINILKLPQADNGLSVKIINVLLSYEPDLAPYIYVFDTPSSDVNAMKKMAALADGITVWGGDAAVTAVRRLAPVNAKLIEWGHKLGFVYISGSYSKKDLEGIAKHIAATKQLLCSSCQVIYLDTENIGELHRFCTKFLPVLEKAVMSKRSVSDSIGSRAYRTLTDYTDMLEGFVKSTETARGKKPLEFKGRGCSLDIRYDNELELSPMMCNVLVKRLPYNKIVPVLRRKKGYLQTVGLICNEEEKEALTRIFSRCGATRIVSPKNMSEYFSGEGHDGEYALRRYVRVVNTV